MTGIVAGGDFGLGSRDAYGPLVYAAVDVGVSMCLYPAIAALPSILRVLTWSTKAGRPVRDPFGAGVPAVG